MSGAPIRTLRSSLTVGPAHLRRWARGPDRGAPAGILDALSHYAQRGEPIDRVAPSVRAFFEQTASLSLEVEPRWRWWAAPLGWIWHAVASVLGQLCIPIVRSTIETTLFSLSLALADRSHARGVWRAYATNKKTMQVIVYSVLEDGGEGFMSACFPLPGAVLEGVLRLECIDRADDGTFGARLTSERRASRDGDPCGVYLHSRWGRVALPLGESLSLWDARASSAPSALREHPRSLGASVVGLHQQRLFGRVMVEHRYWFRATPPR